jgi:histidinol dehydrogenase
MQITRLDAGADLAACARSLRRLAPVDAALRETVAGIIDAVRAQGDAALIEFTERFDRVRIDDLRVAQAAVDEAYRRTDPTMRAALETSAANLGTVARADAARARDGFEVPLDAGQRVRYATSAVRRAGVYIPGGKAAYGSSVIMCGVPAAAAGVHGLALTTPPGPSGDPPDTVLAACRIAGVGEVYRVGGAHAVAALALGTESIPAVDVIAGPGSAIVQEAKRQLFGTVGIDAIAGPSEVMVVCGDGANPDWVALDLCAQGEHGDDSLLIVATPSHAAAAAIAASTARVRAASPTVRDAPVAIVVTRSLEDAVELSNLVAPEHLELFTDDAAALADRVDRAGCVFLGPYGATAFGDYVAGSNHVLPTGAAAAHASPLSVHAFMRRTSFVEIPASAAAALAPDAAVLAADDGFPVHGESMAVRAGS